MWDPQRYLGYADLRARPFYELLARVGAQRPRRVVDQGCGPGNLTAELTRYWPDATLEAFDSSPEMVMSAAEAGVPARTLDVGEWCPEPDTDVVVSNAVLQWVPQHRELLRSWAERLPGEAWFAMQVPGNMAAPSHELTRELASTPKWSGPLAGVRLRDTDAVDDPADYADLFSDRGWVVDAWETTYLHRLTGEDPVLEWISGTALRPVRVALDDDDWRRFRAQLAARLREAYPRRPDGVTWFPFRRIFVVAHRDRWAT